MAIITILAFETNIFEIIIRASSGIKPTNQELQNRQTPKSELVNEAVFIMKILYFKLKTVTIKSFLLTSLTYLVFEKAFMVV